MKGLPVILLSTSLLAFVFDRLGMLILDLLSPHPLWLYRLVHNLTLLLPFAVLLWLTRRGRGP